MFNNAIVSHQSPTLAVRLVQQESYTQISELKQKFSALNRDLKSICNIYLEPITSQKKLRNRQQAQFLTA
jgi:hypothetical protein